MTMDDLARASASLSQASLEATARAIMAFQEDGMPREFTLSTGVVLKLRPIPPFVLQDAMRQIVQPQPPMWLNPDKGREEANPADPDYLAAMDRYSELRIETMTNVAMALGTDLESCPDGMPRPEEDGWIEELEVATDGRVTAPRAPAKARYVAWLRYRAMEKAEDIAILAALPLLLAGISEGEVADSMAGFRGDEERRADPKPSPRRNRADGHRV